MKLKIIKCSEGEWYSNLIGCDFFTDLPLENNPDKIITGMFKISIKNKDNIFSHFNSVMCGILTEDTNYISILRKNKLEQIG